MDWVVIGGLAPYDGRYELDLIAAPLTTREWGWLKRYSGYTPLTLDADVFFSDPEVVAVLALLTLRRNHKIEIAEVPVVWERLQDAPFGATVKYEGGPADDDEDDAGPPPSRSSESSSSSGTNGTTASEISAPSPSSTGPPLSATSASAPVTSAR